MKGGLAYGSLAILKNNTNNMHIHLIISNHFDMKQNKVHISIVHRHGDESYLKKITLALWVYSMEYFGPILEVK